MFCQVTRYATMWGVALVPSMWTMMPGQRRAVPGTIKVPGGTEHVKLGKQSISVFIFVTSRAQDYE